MSNLNLKAIRIDGGTQSRVELNQDTVAEYRAALDDGTELPPIVTFFDGTNHWLADGFHRYFAYQQSDRASIPADVRKGSQRDAVLFSCGTNATHGLRRSNADKRKAVMTLLADPEWSKMSNREIARHCSVDDKSVANWRNPSAAPGAEIRTPKPPTPPKTAGTPLEPEAAPQVPNTPPPADPAAATRPLTEAEQIAHDAWGGKSTLELLEETYAELLEAQTLIAAASADDLKAEAMKWRMSAEISTRRQNELMTTVNQRESELKWHVNQWRALGKLVGEDDPRKIPATVKLFLKEANVPA
jgi:hypothetical protein